MESSEPKWVNSILNIIGVNSLKHEGLLLKLMKESWWCELKIILEFGVWCGHT